VGSLKYSNLIYLHRTPLECFQDAIGIAAPEASVVCVAGIASFRANAEGLHRDGVREGDQLGEVLRLVTHEQGAQRLKQEKSR